MKEFLSSLNKLVRYTVKVLLPVFLGSLIFSGIIAKYNNEMNLNKSILESAYQPMKQQFRKCITQRTKFRNSLDSYQGSIKGLHEGLQEILESSFPRSLMPGPRKSAKDASKIGDKLDSQWLDLLISYESLGSFFDDLTIMLGIHNKRKQYEHQIIECNEIVTSKLKGFELEAILVDVHEASAEKFRKNTPDWIVVFEKISKLLQRLSDLEETLYKAHEADYNSINGMTINELERRYQRNIFGYFMDLF